MNKPTLKTVGDFLAFDYILSRINDCLITIIFEPHQNTHTTLVTKRVTAFVQACRIISRVMAGDKSGEDSLVNHLCFALDRQVLNPNIKHNNNPVVSFLPFNSQIIPPKDSPIYRFLNAKEITPANQKDLYAIKHILNTLAEIVEQSLSAGTSLALYSIYVLLIQATLLINPGSSSTDNYTVILNNYLALHGHAREISTLRIDYY